MLIDSFNQYVQKYDLNDPQIKLKYNHSFRVMEKSSLMASQLGFSKEDIELAKTIGLLHDIGRFEQLKVYHTYDDSKSIDHAAYGVEQLFKKGEIRKFVLDPKDDAIIEAAIKNHNKYRITGVTDERTMMHAKLIRDVDKLDILYNVAYLKGIKTNLCKEPVSKKVLESIRNHQSVRKSDMKNENDFICCKMAFVFDINYDVCLLECRKYLMKWMDDIEQKDLLQEVYQIVMNDIEKRV